MTSQYRRASGGAELQLTARWHGSRETAACAAHGLRGRVPTVLSEGELAQSPNQTAALGATHPSTRK